MLVSEERAYRAVASRDTRFDGCFVTGVRSTGIYCRPSCPARTPKAGNVEFFPTAAAAQQAGYRSCRRCLPDAVPGSPEWDLRADLAGRAMRLVDDGTVDREGVSGLAARLGYSTRHLTRVLTAELGAGPLALARAHRAHTARLLIETTGLEFIEVAHAAGFASLRQFNDTVREVFATTPTALRDRATRRTAPAKLPTGTLRLRLPLRLPFDAAGTLNFLLAEAVPGVEWGSSTHYGRTLRLPHGTGTAELTPRRQHIAATLRLTDLRDLGSAVTRLRRLLDLDCDPVAVDEALGNDPALSGAVRRAPGIRFPGSVDGPETALRAVLSRGLPREAATRRTAALADELGEPVRGITENTRARLFPRPEAVAEHAARVLPRPSEGSAAVRALAERIAEDDIRVDAGRDDAELRSELRDIGGLDPATAEHVTARVLGEPDSLTPTDPVLLRGAARLGLAPERAELTRHARGWSPWRSYAAMHLRRIGAQQPHTGSEEPPDTEEGRE
ncbi:AraC family transcriptional regulator of adaptative response / DNA-3-methyladenine glycosylase II [Actinopolyspora biskrensis]|uniref:AraC family transcriptional regulator of adaptative response / DNA-3-methyladenine glycosylase II n=1 Tax=Actinopolyspora biskrensis TaxID=1470178 RepID=A0A852ZBY7_9ACTN|nr:AlkA N-terminal domain-containing protein [Actinopolyspora biskrensis]NYH80167.1 AraC family transcriptional regulator of adaptative response / DNA-3-methyladenine glycosylase II [Actinopolyspora biskrensis]